jgi:hypothetical protein
MAERRKAERRKAERRVRFPKPDFIDSYQKEKARKLCLDLGTAFPWDDTPQGHEYWAEVRNALNKLGNSTVVDRRIGLTDRRSYIA